MTKVITLTSKLSIVLSPLIMLVGIAVDPISEGIVICPCPCVALIVDLK